MKDFSTSPTKKRGVTRNVGLEDLLVGLRHVGQLSKTLRTIPIGDALAMICCHCSLRHFIVLELGWFVSFSTSVFTRMLPLTSWPLSTFSNARRIILTSCLLSLRLSRYLKIEVSIDPFYRRTVKNQAPNLIFSLYWRLFLWLYITFLLSLYGPVHQKKF